MKYRMTRSGRIWSYARAARKALRWLRKFAITQGRRVRIRWQAERLRRRGEEIRVEVGGRPHPHSAGWIMTNLPELDALDRRHWWLLFRPQSLDRIMAEHVIEHWSEDGLATFLGIVRTYLAPSGVLRIAVPDGYTPDPAYIDRVRPGGSGRGAKDHKVLYTCDSLGAALARAGFKSDLLEYFDLSGEFHKNQWEAADGFIKRSFDQDQRNLEGGAGYTSLIVDARLDG